MSASRVSTANCDVWVAFGQDDAIGTNAARIRAFVAAGGGLIIGAQVRGAGERLLYFSTFFGWAARWLSGVRSSCAHPVSFSPPVLQSWNYGGPTAQLPVNRALIPMVRRNPGRPRRAASGSLRPADGQLQRRGQPAVTGSTAPRPCTDTACAGAANDSLCSSLPPPACPLQGIVVTQDGNWWSQTDVTMDAQTPPSQVDNADVRLACLDASCRGYTSSPCYYTTWSAVNSARAYVARVAAFVPEGDAFWARLQEVGDCTAEGGGSGVAVGPRGCTMPVRLQPADP